MLDTPTPLPEAPRTVVQRDGERLAPGAGAPLLLDGFRLVGTVDDVPPRRTRSTTVQGRSIAIRRRGCGFAATEARGAQTDAVHEIVERDHLLYVRVRDDA
ncbi:MAG: hypothetical protein M0P31_04160 [Solirubrobacteraceae bacterium]|nr:hypothetical protein [Solirubrobacteraceae bacterium]